ERLTHYFSRMHVSAVGSTAKQLLKGDQSMVVVQEETAEDLVGMIPQLCQQEPLRVAGSVENRARRQGLQQVPLGQLQRRLQNCIACVAYALLLLPILTLRVEQL